MQYVCDLGPDHWVSLVEDALAEGLERALFRSCPIVDL
jgi:hypothetical protein